MKRRISNHGRRSLALVLALIMCVSLMNITALAAEGEQTPGDNPEIVLDDVAETKTPEELQREEQIVPGWLKAENGYLGAVTLEGEWNQTELGKVKVSKTIEPTGTENEFIVTLEVQTTENVEEKDYYPDAAVTLIVDVSASMSQCAVCGLNYHIAHDYIDEGPQDDDAGLKFYKAYLEEYGQEDPDLLGYLSVKKDFHCDHAELLEGDVYDAVNVYGPEYAGYYCYEYCGLSESEHQTHDFTARIDAARASAKAFIENLRKDAPYDEEENVYLAHRWVSLVSFSDDAETELKWADITTEAGYNDVLTAIEGLTPNLGANEGGTKNGGTNICAGLKKAQDCIKAGEGKDGEIIDIMSMKNNKYTVLLSDGMPSYYMRDDESVVGDGFEKDTPTDQNYCTQTIKYAENLRQSSGSALYSICFCAARDICYDGTTVIDLLSEMSNNCYSADDADELQIAFENISEQLRFLTEAWVVTDPMGARIVKNEVLKNEIGALQNVGNDTNKISWDLRTDAPIMVATDETGNEKVYTYQLKYSVTLDNLQSGFVDKQPYATNGYTDLTYIFLDENGNRVDERRQPLGDGEHAPSRIGFNVPQVKGYVGDFSFTKTGPDGELLSGAEFTLTLTGEDGKQWTNKATSNNGGVVTFSNIPSGHTYTLTETKAPTEYGVVEPMTVTVSYGEVTVTDNDGNVIEPGEDGYIVTDPYAPGKLTITKTVVGGGDAVNGKTFTFTVTGSEYSETVTLSDGESRTLEGLAPGTYNITEEDAGIYGWTWSADGTGDVTVEAGKEASVTITNTYEPEPDPEPLTVSKVWNDAGYENQRPASVEVRLYSDGAVVETVTLSEDNGWTYTWNELEEGHTYTVEEINVPANYEADVTGDGINFTITNTYEPATPPVTPTVPSTPDEPDEDIPDEDVPQDEMPDIPDEDVPQDETPDIPDEEPTLAELPAEDEFTVEIPEDDVPLDEAPKTGDNTELIVWLVLAIGSGSGLVLLNTQGRKTRKRER